MLAINNEVKVSTIYVCAIQLTQYSTIESLLTTGLAEFEFTGKTMYDIRVVVKCV